MKKVKVKEKVKVEILKDNVTGVKCDWCGKEFDDLMVKCEGYGKVVIEFGYGSSHDEDTYEAEICDDCFKKHFKGKMRKK